MIKKYTKFYTAASNSLENLNKISYVEIRPLMCKELYVCVFFIDLLLLLILDKRSY